MSPGPSLKERLASGERLLGALIRMPNEDVVEMLGVAGFDFLLVDCEHGPADVTQLRHHIIAAQLHGMAVLVRVGAGEDALVLRALDQGAEGIVMPHVDSPEDAAALVRAAHYPPRGDRGFATYPRAGGFGTVEPAEHLDRAERTTLVVAMLESPRAVAAAGEILGTPGVDAFLVGTADLAAASSAGDPPLDEAVAAVRRAGIAAGVTRIDLVGDADAARASFDDGAGLVVYNLTQAQMSLFAGLRVVPRPAGAS